MLREVDRALQREDDERRLGRREKQILFPVTLDGYLFDTWQHPRRADVLVKVVGDFRGWSRNAAKYDGAFQKLIQSLQTPEAVRP